MRASRTPAELVALTEKVLRCGIECDDDASCFVDDDGDVWEVRQGAASPPFLVRALGIQMDFDRYLYGVDDEGDVVIHDKELGTGPDKLVRTGIPLEAGLRYFIKGGDVWAGKPREPSVRVKILNTELLVDKKEYHYFVDSDGDIARRPNF